MTLDEIAAAVNGRVEGDGSMIITGVAALDEAGAGDLSFLANDRYAAAVAATGAAAVIVNETWQGETSACLLRVAGADLAFARAAALISPPPPQAAPGIHPAAVVADTATLGDDVCIGPCCVIEAGARIGARTQLWAGAYVGHDTIIGEDCTLYPNVSIRERCTIGDRVILHCGAVVGSDGFGYVMQEGRWEKIPQVGVVIIGDDAEIGANVTIDRARFGKTTIGRGVKIDNLVQVAHNVSLGDHCALAAQVGIAGSAHVGSHVQMGGQAGVTGHVSIGDQVGIGGRAGVTKDIPSGTHVSGFPALPHAKSMKLQASVARLPELKRKVAGLEKRMQALEGAGDQDGNA